MARTLLIVAEGFLAGYGARALWRDVRSLWRDVRELRDAANNID